MSDDTQGHEDDAPDPIRVLQSKLFATQKAYRAIFGGPKAEEALRDMARFCRENESCIVPGDRDATLVLEGRREVILRIRDNLELSPDDLWKKYGEGQYVER